jgi:FkbM family methyltransferase
MRLVAATTLGRHVLNLAARVSTDLVIEVRHGSHRIRLAGGGWRVDARVRTFSTKEPETLRWLEDLTVNDVLWDVGANIGLYSIYAAIARGVRVVAFEPSPFNLESLARNVALNHLQDRISVVPVGLSSTSGLALLRMSSIERGEGHNTLGETYGQSGRPIQDPTTFPTVGLTADDAVSSLRLPAPTHLKLDVDGIEGLILKGAPAVLAGVRSVLVERPDFDEGSRLVTRMLTEAGLSLTPFDRTGRERANEQWDRRG